jgi:hypothetical protein
VKILLDLNPLKSDLAAHKYSSMTRISSIVALLVSLAFTIICASPMQIPHENELKAASPDRSINLMGVEMAVGKASVQQNRSFRLFNTDIAPGVESSPVQQHNDLRHRASAALNVEQPSPAKKLRLFGQDYDASAIHSKDRTLGSGGEAVLDKSTSVERPSSPLSGSYDPTREATFMNKGKGMAATIPEAPESAPEKSKTGERATLPILNSRPTTKKRTKVFRDNRVHRKSKKLSTIMKAGPTTTTMSVQQERFRQSTATHTIAQQGNKEELLAQHKFRVIDPIKMVEIPFHPKTSGTHHEFGHPDNTHHYLLNADKLLKLGKINREEREQIERNLKKSVRAIDTMMKKKPGTAIYHEQRNIIFQNPGQSPLDEKTSKQYIKKAVRKLQDDKMRRLIVKENKDLSFKKPKADRINNRPAPQSSIERLKLTDPREARLTQEHNSWIAMERPHQKKTWADESSSEGDWMSSTSASSSDSE